MAIVPEGKTVYIGGRKYKAGEQLPASYKLPERKTEVKKPTQAPEKKD